ncbi:MAG: hypothetical protein ACSLEL_01245 [Candidatus Malihini olakiniferum]
MIALHSAGIRSYAKNTNATLLNSSSFTERPYPIPDSSVRVSTYDDEIFALKEGNTLK